MTSRLEQGSLVTVFGGSGFVGRHAVAGAGAPTAGACAPRCAGPISPGTCSRWARSARSMPCRPTCAIPTACAARSRAREAVVNLVGILAKSGPQTFEAVHVAGARAVAEAARAAGAKTLVHVSALGADKRAKANYARTKAAGEAAVLRAISRTPSSCAPRWCSGRRTSCSIASPPWRASRRSCR